MNPSFIVTRDTVPENANPRGAVVPMGNFERPHLGYCVVIEADLQVMALGMVQRKATHGHG
jgi:riboflavin kinase / FMN adenylyltransferase